MHFVKYSSLIDMIYSKKLVPYLGIGDFIHSRNSVIWDLVSRDSVTVSIFCCRCRCDTQHNDSQHNDTQHNNTQHNDTQHNDTQHKGFICDPQYKWRSAWMTQRNNTLLLCWVSLCLVLHFLYLYAECHYAECRYAECRGAHFVSFIIAKNCHHHCDYVIHRDHSTHIEKVRSR